jgi:hypothetical protein
VSVLNAPAATILDSHAHVVHSDRVGDDYQLSVWMPPSYASTDTAYPAVYVLDGSLTFGFSAQATMMSTFGGVVPEVLVVGISRPADSVYAPGPSRARDFSPTALPGDDESGHADAFVEALRTELLPFVDERYRTEPGDRTLWGHSLAGAFALRLCLERRGLFQRFIATSPAVVEQGQPLLDPHTWPAAGSRLSTRLFVSVGADDRDYRPAVESFVDQLRERKYLDLDVDQEVLPGCGHIDAAPGGFLAGIRAVFRPSPHD